MAQSWWDDFSNNLATDLAPFVALLGEAPTKQYLSECIMLEDIILFAAAPLGIITAIVSAIRVCGTPSLRAFVGRAQEGAGVAEAELCSSTSRDVCELYSNGGIARIFGRPKLLEVIHDPQATFEDFYPKDGTRATAGIHFFQDYVNKHQRGRNEWKVELPCEIGSVRYDADPRGDELNINFAPNPNLSLNIGIKQHNRLWFIAAAATGIALQLFVLIWATLARYYYQWTRNSSEDEYAVPMTVIGTILLCFGMGLCARLIERTTKEHVFQRVGFENIDSSAESVWTRSGSSKTSDQKLNAFASTTDTRMYWVQPGPQNIGDQVFDPFAYSDNRFPLRRYITSWKNTTRDSSSMKWIWTASVTTLTGFICQFLGLRACHSSVAVAQFGATILMSLLRASLRTQRLRTDDNLLESDPDCFQGNELDFLALNIAQATARRPTKSKEDQLGPVWWIVNASPLGDIDTGSAASSVITAAPSETNTDESIIKFDLLERLPSPVGGHVAVCGFRVSKDAGIMNGQSPNKLMRKAEEQLSLWKWSQYCTTHETECSPRQSCKHDFNAAVKAVFYRGRLAHLTGLEQPKSEHSSYWGERFVPVRETAIVLALSIEDTMQILFDSQSSDPVILLQPWQQAFSIFWTLRCSFHDRPQAPGRYGDIHMSLRRNMNGHGTPKGPWKTDRSEIEAVLGLWSWSLKSLRTEGLRPIVNLGIHRILSAHRDIESSRRESLHLDTWREAKGYSDIKKLELAIDVSDIDATQHAGGFFAKSRRNRQENESTLRCVQHQNAWGWLMGRETSVLKALPLFDRPTGRETVKDLRGLCTGQFFGWCNVMGEEIPPENKLIVLAIASKDSIVLNCAQEIYSTFLAAIMQTVEHLGTSSAVKLRQRILAGTASNENIKRIQHALIARGLCDEEAAFACTIPVLQRQGKLEIPDET